MHQRQLHGTLLFAPAGRTVFGFGHLHCIFGVERPAFSADSRTGERTDWGILPEDQQIEVQHLEDEAGHRVELATLAPSASQGWKSSVCRLPRLYGMWSVHVFRRNRSEFGKQ